MGIPCKSETVSAAVNPSYDIHNVTALSHQVGRRMFGDKSEDRLFCFVSEDFRIKSNCVRF